MTARSRSDLLAAALLGAAAGWGTIAAPAVLAARDRGPSAGGGRDVAYGAAVGES